MQTAPEISDQRRITEQVKRDIGGTVDLFAKAAAVALSALYILGFCVVSFYLAAYGLHSVALLRVQYLAAGFFSLSPLCVAYVVAALFHLQFRNLPLGPFPASFWLGARWLTLSLLRLVWEFVKIFTVASLIIDGIASIFVPGIQDLLWHHPWIFVRMVRNSVLVVIGILWVHRAFNLVDKEKRGLNFTTVLQIGVPAILAIFFFLVYMNQFSVDVYPRIPFALGGGKPQSVVFLLKHFPEPSPVVRDKTSDRSVPYSLILETDGSYSVISSESGERAIQFNREAVEGYVALKQMP